MLSVAMLHESWKTFLMLCHPFISHPAIFPQNSALKVSRRLIMH